jgi:hypothetical protein
MLAIGAIALALPSLRELDRSPVRAADPDAGTASAVLRH